MKEAPELGDLNNTVIIRSILLEIVCVCKKGGCPTSNSMPGRMLFFAAPFEELARHGIVLGYIIKI